MRNKQKYAFQYLKPNKSGFTIISDLEFDKTLNRYNKDNSKQLIHFKDILEDIKNDINEFKKYVVLNNKDFFNHDWFFGNIRELVKIDSKSCEFRINNNGTPEEKRYFVRKNIESLDGYPFVDKYEDLVRYVYQSFDKMVKNFDLAIEFKSAYDNYYPLKDIEGEIIVFPQTQAMLLGLDGEDSHWDEFYPETKKILDGLGLLNAKVEDSKLFLRTYIDNKRNIKDKIFENCILKPALAIKLSRLIEKDEQRLLYLKYVLDYLMKINGHDTFLLEAEIRNIENIINLKKSSEKKGNIKVKMGIPKITWRRGFKELEYMFEKLIYSGFIREVKKNALKVIIVSHFYYDDNQVINNRSCLNATSRKFIWERDLKDLVCLFMELQKNNYIEGHEKVNVLLAARFNKVIKESGKTAKIDPAEIKDLRSKINTEKIFPGDSILDLIEKFIKRYN